MSSLFFSWLRFGQISNGRNRLYSSLDFERNDSGSAWQSSSIPKLEWHGSPSSFFCLVNVKSKSVTTCNSFGPPLTISLRSFSTRNGSFILQFNRANSSISPMWIQRCCELVVIFRYRFCWQNTATTCDVNVVHDVSNLMPTNRWNLYACQAKLNRSKWIKYNGIFLWKLSASTAKFLEKRYKCINIQFTIIERFL